MPALKEKPKASTNLEATAYHEAGHAVMHCLLKTGFKYITIEPDEMRGSLGHVVGYPKPNSIDPECDNGPKVRQYIENAIMCSFAGGIAEELFTGVPDQDGCEFDYAHLVDMLSYISSSPDEMQAHLDLLYLRTEDLLQRQDSWAMVTALANALLALPDGQRKLSAQRARQVMRKTAT